MGGNNTNSCVSVFINHAHAEDQQQKRVALPSLRGRHSSEKDAESVVIQFV